MKLKSLIYALIFSNLLGCASTKTLNLKPMIEDCCVSNQTHKTSKKILVGQFKLIDEKNKKNVFGSWKGQKEGIEEIKLKESLNDILRNEYLRRLKHIAKDVQLVDRKPKALEDNTIFIEGYVDIFWLDNSMELINTKKGFISGKTGFVYNNTYLLDITTNINSRNVKDTIIAEYNNKGSFSISDDSSKVSAGVFGVIFGGFVPGTSMRGFTSMKSHRKLSMNETLIADVKYDLDSSIPMFGAKVIKEELTANIYNKDSILIKAITDKTSLEDEKSLPFMYATINIGGAIEPYVPWISWDKDYKTKSEIKLNKEIAKVRRKNDALSNKNKSIHSELDDEDDSDYEYYDGYSHAKYHDLFRLYTSNSGITQYMINYHIDNLIKTLKNQTLSKIN